MEYVLGIDGGGTKAAAAAMDRSGAVRERFSVGAVNVNSEPAQAVAARLAELKARVRQRFPQDDCAAVCAGVAGYTNPATARVWEEAFGGQGRFLLTGDHATALEGALDGAPGMIVIAGTGSICTGRAADGATARAGGYGHLLDDGGSGYAVAIGMLSAVVQAQDGRIAPTVLTQLVYRALEVSDIGGLVAAVYREGRTKKEIASLAPLLDEAARQGDAAALAVARRAGTELFLLADTVCRRLALEDAPCALLGSILQKSAPVRAAFEGEMRREHPGVRCIAPLRDAAEGAGLLALRLLRDAPRPS